MIDVLMSSYSILSPALLSTICALQLANEAELRSCTFTLSCKFHRCECRNDLGENLIVYATTHTHSHARPHFMNYSSLKSLCCPCWFLPPTKDWIFHVVINITNKSALPLVPTWIRSQLSQIQAANNKNTAVIPTDSRQKQSCPLNRTAPELLLVSNSLWIGFIENKRLTVHWINAVST